MQKNTVYVGNELALFSKATVWKRYWRSKITPYIKGHALEVGAGLGANAQLLRGYAQTWTCIEPDPKQCEAISTLPLDALVVNGTLDNAPADKLFNTIMYIDVLEHIEDDLGLVQQAFSLLEQGGSLIVLSPAHQRLFSPFDSAVGHFRRYDKASLKALTPKATDEGEGYEPRVSACFYLDSVGYLASLANSTLLKQSMPTEGQIQLWDKVMVRLSTFLDPLIRYTAGKTIVIVWTKT